MRNSLKFIQPKLLLLEKPLSISLSEAKEISYLLEKYPNVKIAVNYIRRYLPSTNFWLDKIKSGQLGNLVFGNIFYGKGILCNGSHFINLAEYWLGKLKLKNYFNSGKAYLDFDREISINFEVVDHNSSSLMVHSTGEAGIRSGEIDLWFEKGRLKWENNDTSINFFNIALKNTKEEYLKLENIPHKVDIGIEKYQYEVINSLYWCLNENSSKFIKCNLDEALSTLNLVDFKN